jgi:hypothetical protein
VNPFADSQLERLRYWQGQMLRSRDFNDQAAFAAQMRWWHNRSLHRAFGVCRGLEATAIFANDGTLSGVHVNGGVAYDCFGRELVLCPGAVIPLPEGNNLDTLLLIIRRKAATSSARSKPACAPDDCLAGRDDAELAWKQARERGALDGVPLARIVATTNGGPKLGLDPALVPPIARALSRPHLAGGATLPGKTVWEAFYAGGSGKIPRGVQTRVDTSTAGFADTPCYFAWIETMRKQSDVDLSSLLLLSLPRDIVAASANGFTFRILTPLTLASLRKAAAPGLHHVTKALAGKAALNLDQVSLSFTSHARKTGLHLCWLGCEHVPEISPCRPVCDCDCSGEQPGGPLDRGEENHHAH